MLPSMILPKETSDDVIQTNKRRWRRKYDPVTFHPICRSRLSAKESSSGVWSELGVDCELREDFCAIWNLFAIKMIILNLRLCLRPLSLLPLPLAHSSNILKFNNDWPSPPPFFPYKFNNLWLLPPPLPSRLLPSRLLSCRIEFNKD